MKIGMGIIKVEVSFPEAAKALEEFRREPKRTFELISNEVKLAVSNVFNQLLQTEMSIFLVQIKRIIRETVITKEILH